MSYLRPGVRSLAWFATIGTVVAFGAGCTSDPSDPGTRASATSVVSTSTKASGGAGRGGDDLQLMSNLDWQKWNGIKLPFSDEFGPQSDVDGIASGYSHSAGGAMLAMLQTHARLDVADDADWLRQARAQAVIAPADTPPVDAADRGARTRGPLPYFYGFKWLSYDPNRAVADIALQNLDHPMSKVTLAAVWTGTDWKLELPSGGAHPSEPLSSLDGFEPWPAVPRR